MKATIMREAGAPLVEVDCPVPEPGFRELLVKRAARRGRA